VLAGEACDTPTSKAHRQKGRGAGSAVRQAAVEILEGEWRRLAEGSRRIVTGRHGPGVQLDVGKEAQCQEGQRRKRNPNRKKKKNGGERLTQNLWQARGRPSQCRVKRFQQKWDWGKQKESGELSNGRRKKRVERVSNRCRRVR